MGTDCQEWKGVVNMAVFPVIALICGSEYVIKKHVDETQPLSGQHVLAGGRIILKKYHNAGAAGNILKDSPRLMLCIHAAVLGGVVTELLRLFPQKDAGVAKTGLALLAGGGLSNLYDRLTKGYVTDYVSFGFGPARFRKLVFNLADFCIFAGALLVSAAFLFRPAGK